MDRNAENETPLADERLEPQSRYCPTCDRVVAERRCGACEQVTYAVDPDFPPGTELGKHWRIDGRLGGGGMGSVFAGRDRRTGGPVAIKVLDLRRSGVETEEDLARAEERFRREADCLAHLTHPSTVRVYHFGVRQDGLLFMVMERVQGKTLLRVMNEVGALPPARAVAIARQILGSLGEAHARGIVHRDLKPANVMLSEHLGVPDFVKVLDFGIALRPWTHEARLTADHQVVGSTPYVAPEQIEGAGADHRVDLYALGVLLYELLSGRYPYRIDANANPLAAYLGAHTQQTPIPMAVANPSVPRALGDLVLRLLAKNPAARYPDAAAVIAALDATSLEAPSLAVIRDVDSGPAPTDSGARRRRMRLARAIAAGAVVGLVWHGLQRAEPGTVAPVLTLATLPVSALPVPGSAPRPPEAPQKATAAAAPRPTRPVELVARRDRRESEHAHAALEPTTAAAPKAPAPVTVARSKRPAPVRQILPPATEGEPATRARPKCRVLVDPATGAKYEDCGR